MRGAIWTVLPLPSQCVAQNLEFFRQVAEAGNVEAQFKLAVALSEGETGVEKNLEEAAEYCQKAAEGGNAWAQYQLGDFYETGKGVEIDLVKAAQWYLKSAMAGNAWAQCNLGNFYKSGKGVMEK